MDDQKTKKGPGIKKIYLSILENFEREKEKILKEYMANMENIKTAGMKEIEKVMIKGEKENAEQLLNSLEDL